MPTNMTTTVEHRCGSGSSPVVVLPAKNLPWWPWYLLDSSCNFFVNISITSTQSITPLSSSIKYRIGQPETLRTWGLVKFKYSEKATKFCEISTVDLTFTKQDKSAEDISQNFVAFSENMNFTTSTYFGILVDHIPIWGKVMPTT